MDKVALLKTMLLLSNPYEPLVIQGPPIDPPPRRAIVVIDTGVSRNQVGKDFMCKHIEAVRTVFNDTGLSESSDKNYTYRQHGPNVIGLIAERIDITQYCIVSIRAFNTDVTYNKDYFKALFIARSVPGVAAVNLSIGTTNPEPDSYLEEEYDFIKHMLKRGTTVVTAIGNNDKKLTTKNCFVYPACLRYRERNERFKVVVSGVELCDDGECVVQYRHRSNRTHLFPTAVEDGYMRGIPPMSGTSQAAAVHTGKLFSQ